jgi:hypothetical protein
MENKNMNQDLLADVWNVLGERIPEKDKQDAASEFVNLLLDYDITETTLEGMLGIDTYLDTAIEYALEDEPGEHNEWDD